MIVWPKNIIDDIALRKSVIVLGSGVSANSVNAAGQRPKTWKSFLETGCAHIADLKVKREVLKLISQNDFLTACEILKTTLGSFIFNNFVISEYQAPGYQPASIHETIYRLDSKIVITPNFDNIYDRYASTTSAGTVTVKEHTDDDIVEALRINKRLILKIHGKVETPNNLIFTRESYAQARQKYKSMYEVLDALLITHTFLFLGCGTNDPDIRLLLEDYRHRFRNSGDHYFVLSKTSASPSVKNILEQTLKIKLLEYSTIGGAHTVLLNSLVNLADQVEATRTEIALTQGW
ncbi:SIR2 family protein [Spirosoma oryzicola]|uniref:SIR2 family protein n=1 Tax=Spirosoma oryzicola TaxID=2898794 RepID=UPI001E5FA131|nr:SIR2 family protein [Spirosoma oryzicola]UHG94668.1 SIR2 family protein [Spirosoma oryzicola]